MKQKRGDIAVKQKTCSPTVLYQTETWKFSSKIENMFPCSSISNRKWKSGNKIENMFLYSSISNRNMEVWQ